MIIFKPKQSQTLSSRKIMWKAAALLMVIVAMSAEVFCAQVEEDEELDPFDMVHFDHANMRMKKKATTTTEKPEQIQPPSKEEQKMADNTPKEDKRSDPVQETKPAPPKDDERPESAPPSEQEQKTTSGESCPALSLFQQFVARLLRFVGEKVSQVDGDMPTDLCLLLQLTPHQVEMLESFKRDHSKDSVFSAHDILSEAVQGTLILNSDDPRLRYLWVERYFGVTLDKAIQIMTLITSAVVLAVLLPKIRFMWILVSGFWISVAMTWFRLYKIEIAKQQEALMKDMPAGCGINKPDKEYSFWSAIGSYITSQVTFQKDACVTYYEHLVIDPVVMVTPAEALAVALVQTVLKPLRTVGTEISAFLRALVKDLPIQWQFVSVVIVCVFLALILFLICGYRLRIPWLLSIEPSHWNKALEVKALKQTIRELQSALDDTKSGQQGSLQACDTVGALPLNAPGAATVTGPTVRAGEDVLKTKDTCQQCHQPPITVQASAEKLPLRGSCQSTQEMRTSKTDVRQMVNLEDADDTNVPEDDNLLKTVRSGGIAAEKKRVQAEYDQDIKTRRRMLTVHMLQQTSKPVSHHHHLLLPIWDTTEEMLKL